MVFADGFAGAYKDPGRAAFRPTGLAEGPNGALYVSDDVHGRIWRIRYNGDGSDKVAPAPAPMVAATAPGSAMPPEGMHPDAGRTNPALPTPPGATADQVTLGNRIFHGEASDGTCSGCHGSDAGGSTVGPALNSGHWLWGDGGLAASHRDDRERRGAAQAISGRHAAPWAGCPFRRGTWRRWRHMFGPSAMPGSHEAAQ